MDQSVAFYVVLSLRVLEVVGHLLLAIAAISIANSLAKRG